MPHTSLDLTGIADGQGLLWDDALQKFVPWTPGGDAEVLYAENATTTVTTASVVGAGAGTAVNIPNCVLTDVPISSRPLWIYYQSDYTQSVAGTGTAFLLLVETTVGNTGTRSFAKCPLPNSTGTQLKNMPTLGAWYRLGATAALRSFKLQIQLSAPAANSPSATAVNTVANPSLITVVAR